MAPTLVNVAVGVLLGIALLGPAFDRRSLTAVALAAAVPDLDAALSLLVPGATNAALHSLFIPVVAAGLLYWDTELRARSAVRTRYGWDGVRVGWVVVAVYAVAGIGLDLFAGSVAVLYPLSDRYLAITGHFVLSTQDGVVQSYVQFGDGWLGLHSPGMTDSHHVATWINPTPGTDTPAGVERRLRIVDAGWQAVIVLSALAAIPARVLVGEDWSASGDDWSASEGER